MNRHAIAAIIAYAATMFFSTAPLLGQAEPDSVKRRNNCRVAVQVFTTGHPHTHLAWANSYLPVCSAGDRSRAYVARAQRARQSSDLGEIRLAVMPLGGFRDGNLFEVVLALAADRGATLQARVVAFMALSQLLHPDEAPDYAGFLGGLNEFGLARGDCSRQSMHRITLVPGATPVPVDHVARVQALARQTAADPSEPADIRSAAACTI